MTFPIVVTETAYTKAWELLTREQREDLRLRVQVTAGGCSGLRYKLFFDDAEYDGDVIEMFGEVEVIVDLSSSPYLTGAVVDYEDSIQKQGFTIDNPNAEDACACGDSFH